MDNAMFCGNLLLKFLNQSSVLCFTCRDRLAETACSSQVTFML